jgi:hypothetical protein
MWEGERDGGREGFCPSLESIRNVGHMGYQGLPYTFIVTLEYNVFPHEIYLGIPSMAYSAYFQLGFWKLLFFSFFQRG